MTEQNGAAALAIPAIVLAGGKPNAGLAAMGISNRALVPIDGIPMLTRVVAALRAAPSVGSVVVVGDVPPDPSYHSVADHGGFVENILAGTAALGPAPYVVVSTSDMPFLSGAAVDDFVRRGAVMGADMVYPVVPVELCYARYPGVRRTALSLRDGRLTGGNMVLARPAFLTDRRERLAQAYAARKSVMGLARRLGAGVLVGVALSIAGRPVMSVARLEGAVSRLVDGTARALWSEFPEIATDLDRPEDFQALGLAPPP
jgi:molybdopterin-guanine dinucleotide biosynthesis protein A